jgi:hypothetical protein
MKAPSKENLLPCPFCGGKAQIKMSQYCEDGMETWVECKDCHVATDRCDGPYGLADMAAASWNMRTQHAKA